MAKQGEIDYLKNIGQDGIQHAVHKPFSDPECGKYLSELGAVFTLLPPPPARLLDIGCGTGWTSRFFARRGYEVVGIDMAVWDLETTEGEIGSGRVTWEIDDLDVWGVEPDIDERQAAAVPRLTEFAEAETQQDALLHPCIHDPPLARLFRSADFALGKGMAEFEEDFARFRIALDFLQREETFDGGLQRLHGREV